jgi:ribose 5-phosphate isomerase B
MRIAVAADHAGFALKEALKSYLVQLGHEVMDFGTHSEEMVDYPDLAAPAARAVAAGECDRGVFCCGTGLGVMLTANKVRGIRAVVCHECFSARMSRLHNDANVLCLGGRVHAIGLAQELVHVWLETPFEGGRHAVRVDKIKALEATE